MKLFSLLAMIHEILYVHVFKYPQEVIRQTVVEMLQEKKYARLRVERKRYARHRALYGMPVDDLPEKLSVLPPISYKDAKALDLALFRNITMDIWLQKNRDRFIAMKLAELQPGDRCVLTFSGRQGGRKALCTIIQKDDDHRFQVELSDGQQVTVPVRELELLSKRKERHATYSAGNKSRTSPEMTQSSPEVSPAFTASPVLSSNNSQVENHTGQVWYPPLDLHTGGWFDPCLQFFPPIDYFSYHTAYSTAQHASVSGGQQMLSFPFPLQMIQYPYLGV